MIYHFIHSSREHWGWTERRQINDILHIIDGKGQWFRNLSIYGEDWSTNNITDEINKWMKENNISYPFQNKEHEMLFRLRFE